MDFNKATSRDILVNSMDLAVPEYFYMFKVQGVR